MKTATYRQEKSVFIIDRSYTLAQKPVTEKTGLWGTSKFGGTKTLKCVPPVGH
jgi:hypothetical protein